MTALACAPEATETSEEMSARAAQTIADGLTTLGFDACIPTHRHSTLIQVTNVTGAMCQLIIFDTGVFDWEYRYRDSSRSDPSVLAAMVMCILGANHAAGSCAPVAYHPRLTLKGQIGRTLASQGMRVRLNIIDEDESALEVYSEIAITNPACASRGFVCVADDGLVHWRGRISNPEDPASGLDLDEITGTLARALTTAMPEHR
jgi:hypothetical protein